LFYLTLQPVHFALVHAPQGADDGPAEAGEWTMSLTGNAQGGSLPPSDLASAGMQPGQVPVWRKAKRLELLEMRMAVPSAQRDTWSAQIADHLLEQILASGAKIVSAYWPIRGEPELRPLLRALAEHGVRTALPVAIALRQPLVFREWKSGDRLERGLWKIPFPADGAVVIPDVVISPVVGFDPANYRLGYGGGFFDRTLAILPERPLVLGVGYSMAAIPTIHPQPHDIAMSRIVTERGAES
jgi:5-formyltetrahydrofolate cyclo-ligase